LQKKHKNIRDSNKDLPDCERSTRIYGILIKIFQIAEEAQDYPGF
jgi:hypothetical protein